MPPALPIMAQVRRNGWAKPRIVPTPRRALEAAGVNEQRQAAVGAGALEEQARALRESADQRAKALERQAAEIQK